MLRYRAVSTTPNWPDANHRGPQGSAAGAERTSTPTLHHGRSNQPPLPPPCTPDPVPQTAPQPTPQTALRPETPSRHARCSCCSRPGAKPRAQSTTRAAAPHASPRPQHDSLLPRLPPQVSPSPRPKTVRLSDSPTPRPPRSAGVPVATALQRDVARCAPESFSLAYLPCLAQAPDAVDSSGIYAAFHAAAAAQGAPLDDVQRFVSLAGDRLTTPEAHSCPSSAMAKLVLLFGGSTHSVGICDNVDVLHQQCQHSDATLILQSPAAAPQVRAFCRPGNREPALFLVACGQHWVMLQTSWRYSPTGSRHLDVLCADSAIGAQEQSLPAIQRFAGIILEQSRQTPITRLPSALDPTLCDARATAEAMLASAALPEPLVQAPRADTPRAEAPRADTPVTEPSSPQVINVRQTVNTFSFTSTTTSTQTSPLPRPSEVAVSALHQSAPRPPRLEWDIPERFFDIYNMGLLHSPVHVLVINPETTQIKIAERAQSLAQLTDDAAQASAACSQPGQNPAAITEPCSDNIIVGARLDAVRQAQIDNWVASVLQNDTSPANADAKRNPERPINLDALKEWLSIPPVNKAQKLQQAQTVIRSATQGYFLPTEGDLNALAAGLGPAQRRVFDNPHGECQRAISAKRTALTKTVHCFNALVENWERGETDLSALSAVLRQLKTERRSLIDEVQAQAQKVQRLVSNDRRSPTPVAQA